MAAFDVRNSNTEEITEIVFAEKESKGCYLIANKISKTNSSNFSAISDGEWCVLIDGKNHAENLIKALRKAIELGWIK